MFMSDFIIENSVLKSYKGQEEIVYIPEGVKVIGNSAFRFNSYIKTVHIPEGVDEIQQGITANVNLTGAFDNCRNLEEVILPSTLEVVGMNAFAYCHKLKSIKIPESVLSIEPNAFFDCTELKFLYVPNKDCKIDAGVFAHSGIEEVILPAYHGLYFNYAKNLRVVTITTGLQDAYQEVRETANSKFVMNHPEKNISFDNKGDCLEKIYAPYCSLDRIYDAKIQAVRGHVELVIKNTMPIIADEIALSYKTYITKQRKKLYPLMMEDEYLLAYMTTHKIIPANQIDECISMTSKKEVLDCLIAYKETLGTKPKKTAAKKIKEDNKENAKVEKQAVVTSKQVVDQKFIDKNYPVKYQYIDANHSFPGYYVGGCKADANEFIFPQVVKKHPIRGINNAKDTLDNYKKVERIVIPEGYVSIGKNAFKGCENLKEVVLPASLQRIYDQAFMDCISLKEIVLPIRLSQVGKKVFHGSGIEKITILTEDVRFDDAKWFSNIPVKEIVVPQNHHYNLPKNKVKFLENELSDIEKLYKKIKLYSASSFNEELRLDALLDKENNTIHNNISYIGEGNSSVQVNQPVVLEFNPKENAVSVLTEDGVCLGTELLSSMVKACGTIVGKGHFRFVNATVLENDASSLKIVYDIEII